MSCIMSYIVLPMELTHFIYLFGGHGADILWDTWCGWVGGCAGIHTGLSTASTSGERNQITCSNTLVLFLVSSPGPFQAFQYNLQLPFFNEMLGMAVLGTRPLFSCTF
jgi:hypothetical protein